MVNRIHGRCRGHPPRPSPGPVGAGIFLVWGVPVRPLARLLIMGGGGACFKKNDLPKRLSFHVSFGAPPAKTLKPTPVIKRNQAPRETTFCEGCRSTPTHTLGGSQSSRRRRQAAVPAAGRCDDEHAPRDLDLARRPAGCSQKAPWLGSERKSSGSKKNNS